MKPGDTIDFDTPLATLETDKATMDVPSTAKGVVEKVHVTKGGSVGPGALVVTVKGISATLRRQMVAFIHEIRTLDLKKLPSVSETIDWARVLVLLQAAELDHEIVKDTLNVLLKYETDIEAALPQVSTFVAKAARQNVFG